MAHIYLKSQSMGLRRVHAEDLHVHGAILGGSCNILLMEEILHHLKSLKS